MEKKWDLIFSGPFYVCRYKTMKICKCSKVTQNFIKMLSCNMVVKGACSEICICLKKMVGEGDREYEAVDRNKHL